MDFALSAEQLELKKSVCEFASKELNRGIRERDRSGRFPRKEWEACAGFGVQGLPVPKAYGGGGADLLTAALAMEALGYGCHDNGLLFSLGAQMWSVEMPLVAFGSEEQRRSYLPGLVAGKTIGAHALTEAEAGSDAFSLRTRAEKKGGRYVLNGSKQYVTNGPVADVAIVYAALWPKKGLAGVTAFLVEKGTPGFEAGKGVDKMGLRTSPLGEMVLTDCEVPPENRLGREGGGFAVFNSSLEMERAFIVATAVGTMQRQLEACVRYASSRRQFGRPIGKFEGVSNKIAEMYMRVEAARLLVQRAAWLLQEGSPAAAEASAAKAYASEAWVQTCLDAIQVHGALGYTTEAEVERDLRDAVAGKIYSGTSEVQRLIIAGTLGL